MFKDFCVAIGCSVQFLKISSLNIHLPVTLLVWRRTVGWKARTPIAKGLGPPAWRSRTDIKQQVYLTGKLSESVSVSSMIGALLNAIVLVTCHFIVHCLLSEQASYDSMDATLPNSSLKFILDIYTILVAVTAICGIGAYSRLN